MGVCHIEGPEVRATKCRHCLEVRRVRKIRRSSLVTCTYPHRDILSGSGCIMEIMTDRCTRGTSQIETFRFVVIYGAVVGREEWWIVHR